jgi:succinate dehydrogenase / fumarate reductase cytochrome b subunit
MAQAETKGGGPDARPLSPHLQVYTPLINMVMSIVHRITGAALYFGTLILVVWLYALASDPGAYVFITRLINTPIGLLVMIGYTWALLHHAFGGLRHLIWDSAKGLEIGSVNALCWATLILSLVCTAGVWVVIGQLQGWL